MQYSTVNVLGLFAAAAMAAPGAENCGDNYNYSPSRCNNCPYTGEHSLLEGLDYEGMCQRECPREKRVCRDSDGHGLLDQLSSLQRYNIVHNQQVSCAKDFHYDIDIKVEECGREYEGQQCLNVRYLNGRGAYGNAYNKRGDNNIDDYNAGINSYGNAGFNTDIKDRLQNIQDKDYASYDRGHGDYRQGDYRQGDYRQGDYRQGDYRQGISSCNLGVYSSMQEIYEPRQLNFNNYCSRDYCSVPTQQLPDYPNMCGQKMYLAVGNDECYNDYGLNPEGYRQATKYIEVQVDCEQEEQDCEDYCCCP